MHARRALAAIVSLALLYSGAALLRAEEPKKEEKKPSTCIPALKDEHRHKQFLKDKEAQLKKGPIQVVFDGDSITDGWRNDAKNNGGKQVWEKEFAKYNPLNLGIGG